MREFSIEAGATEIMLVRHAEAEHPTLRNEVDFTHLDLPLTERGRQQALALANRLRRRPIGAVYSSSSQRTRETAAIVADAVGHRVHEDDRLAEIEVTGVSGSISLHDLGEIAIAQGGWSHLPGTEPSHDVRHRMRTAIDDIAALHPGQRVVVVSHAGAINAYFANLLGLEHDFFFPAGNTSISSVRARGERRLLVSLNDIAHLEALRKEST
jgi:2,3-bisphosphoglycerate-dependent phosphoglycerate mutase